jgi:hypothetical protein
MFSSIHPQTANKQRNGIPLLIACFKIAIAAIAASSIFTVARFTAGFT